MARIGGDTPGQAGRFNLAPALGFVGPFVDQQPMATGKIYQLSTVAAAGTLTIKHGLGRIPVYVQVLINGTPGYPGGAFITAADATNVTIQFANAQTSGSFAYIS